MDINQTYCGNHFTTYKNIKSLCCNLKLIYCFMSIIPHEKEWPKSKHPMTPNATEEMEQQELTYLAIVNA